MYHLVVENCDILSLDVSDNDIDEQMVRLIKDQLAKNASAYRGSNKKHFVDESSKLEVSNTV